MEDNDWINNLKIRREELNKELEDTAIAMANIGKKFYDLKEELKIVNIKLNKVNEQ